VKRGTKALWRGLAGLALLAAVLALADPARVLAALRHADAAWLLAGLAAAIASSVASRVGISWLSGSDAVGLDLH